MRGDFWIEPYRFGGFLTFLEGRILGGTVFVEQVRKLVRFHVAEGFALQFNVLYGFYDSFGHLIVRLFRSAYDGKIFCLGDALVPVVVVETDPEEMRLLCLIVWHGSKYLLYE